MSSEFRKYRGKDKHTNKWVEGFFVETQVDPYIVPGSISVSEKGPVWDMHTVIESTVGAFTGRYDVDDEPVYQGDFVRSVIDRTSVFEIKYGEHEAYCYLDREWMPTIGFYAESFEEGQFPIGELNKWARVIGNRTDNPEMVKEDLHAN